MAAKRVGACGLALAAGMRRCYPCLAADRITKNADPAEPICPRHACIRWRRGLQWDLERRRRCDTAQWPQGVNDDTMANLPSYDGQVSMFLMEDYRRGVLGRAGRFARLPFRLSLGVRLESI